MPAATSSSPSRSSATTASGSCSSPRATTTGCTSRTQRWSATSSPTTASAAGRGDAFAIGVLVRGGRRDGLARNLITGHPGAGVLLTSSDEAPAQEVSVQGNLLRHNGIDLAVAPRAGQRTSKGSCFAQNRFSTSRPEDIEKALPCQSDVPLDTGPPPLPAPPPPVDWRSVALPAPQPQMPDAANAKPKPARRPGRLDVAKVGVPGES
jgi:hypothetical protein